MPFYDANEKKAWQAWLKKKYKGDISLLRETWGRNQFECPDFGSIDFPTAAQYHRSYDMAGQYKDYVGLNDFYEFARQTHSEWDAMLRAIVKKNAPKMLFMIGRDESLRVPS